MAYLKEGSPARYHLAPTPTGIEIGVHKTAAAILTEIKPDIENSKVEDLKLVHSFIPPSKDRPWGFGEIIKTDESENPDWVLYSLDFPPLLGKKGERSNHEPQIAVSATLDTLFTRLWIADIDIKDNYAKQQMHIKNGVFKLDESALGVRLGYPIGAVLFEDFVRWSRQHSSVNLRKGVENTMKSAHARLWGGEKKATRLLASEFNMNWVEPKWLHLSVSGNACGLEAEMDERYLDTEEDLDSGYRLTPHNVDGPVQQFSLLSGLAALEEMAVGQYYKLPHPK